MDNETAIKIGDIVQIIQWGYWWSGEFSPFKQQGYRFNSPTIDNEYRVIKLPDERAWVGVSCICQDLKDNSKVYLLDTRKVKIIKSKVQIKGLFKNRIQ